MRIQRAGLTPVFSSMLLALLAIGPATAFAERSALVVDGVPCGSEDAQYFLNECAKLEFKAADARMSKVFQSVLARTPAPARSALAAEQAAWRSQLLRACVKDVDEGEPGEGGSAQTQWLNECMTAKVRQRIAELEAGGASRDRR